MCKEISAIVAKLTHLSERFMNIRIFMCADHSLRWPLEDTASSWPSPRLPLTHSRNTELFENDSPRQLFLIFKLFPYICSKGIDMVTTCCVPCFWELALEQALVIHSWALECHNADFEPAGFSPTFEGLSFILSIGACKWVRKPHSQ
jgi:hypothetical protein